MSNNYPPENPNARINFGYFNGLRYVLVGSIQIIR